MRQLLFTLLLLAPLLSDAQIITEKYLDGSKYVGEFKDGMYNGHGTRTWPNGSSYVGGWRDNQLSGTGTMTWHDGRTYVGGWYEGRYASHGTETWPDGRTYVGTWRNGQRYGRGTYTVPDVLKYEGGWEDDIFNGQGILTLSNGGEYVGEFKDGMKHGQGTMAYADGTKDAGVWEEGVFLGPKEINAKTNTTSTQGSVVFNQVPKDVVVNAVAVLPIEGRNCRGETVNGQDIASFTEGMLLGIYNIVERRHLEQVLDEQKLAMTGIIYEKSAVEAGCSVGAQGIIFTEYGCLTGQETIQLKLVDCQTSELYWSATGINATASEVLNKVRQELEVEKD